MEIENLTNENPEVKMEEALASVFNLHLLGVLAGGSKDEHPFVLTTDERPLIEEVLRLSAARVGRMLGGAPGVKIYQAPDERLIGMEAGPLVAEGVGLQLKAAVTAYALAFIAGERRVGLPDYEAMGAEHVDIIRAMTGNFPDLSFHAV